MNPKTFLRILFMLMAPAMVMHCASYSSFQTANTVGKGKLGGSIGLGNNYMGEEPYFDLAIRVGAGNSLDIGGKVNHTNFGSTIIMLDFKRQLPTKDNNLKMAIGGGISPVLSEHEGLAIHWPYYLSLHSNNQKFATYINPRLLYYFDFYKESEIDNSGLGIGSSIGLKFGNRFAIMPEWGFLYGRYDNEPKLNNFFSVGVGFNVK